VAVSCRHHLSACWRESAKHVGRAPGAGRQGGPPDPRRTPPSPLWTPPWTPPRPSPVDPLTLSCYPVLSGAICLSVTIRYNLDRSHQQSRPDQSLLVYNKITHSTRPRTRLVQTRGEGLTFAHRHPHGNGGRGRDRFIHRPSPSSLAVLLQRTSAATVAPSSLIPSSPTYTRLSYGAQCPLAIRLPM
jgi:hypothetical protein